MRTSHPPRGAPPDQSCALLWLSHRPVPLPVEPPPPPLLSTPATVGRCRQLGAGRGIEALIEAAVEGQPPPLPPPSPPLPPPSPPPSPPPPIRRARPPGPRLAAAAAAARSGLGACLSMWYICHIGRHTMTPSGPCVLVLYSYSCTAMTSFRALRLRQHDATSPLLDPIPFLGLHRPRTAHPCIQHSRRSWSEHCAQMHAEYKNIRSWRGMPTGNEPPTS